MPKRLRPLTALYFGLWAAYFSFFWWHALRYDQQGNLIAGNANLWADWALHFTLGQVMVEREWFPAMSPIILNQPFSYPFAADLLSAVLMKIGMGMVTAFVVPSYFCSILIVWALFYFLKALFRSEAVAAIGATLFFLIGGVGFIQFAQELAASPQPLDLLFNPPHEYTRLNDEGIVLLSFIDGIIIPQRSFTLGFPLTLLALGLIRESLSQGTAGALPGARLGKLTLAALMLGVLPIVHAHSLVAAFVILLFWAASSVLLGAEGTAWQRMRPWLYIALVTSLVALPLIRTFASHAVSESFFRWYPGWYARELNVNWVVFWIKNWSLTPVLAVAGLLLWTMQARTIRQRAEAAFLVAPFLVLFVLVNLVVFAPWIWDNGKLLAWAAVGICGLAAYFCVVLWNKTVVWQSAIPAPRLLMRLSAQGVSALIVATLLACVASGAIDAYRVVRADRQAYTMYTEEDFRMAEWVKRHTEPGSIWLTGDQHNHWLINLTGRQPLLGYRGWVWSHGYTYQALEQDISKMFATADPALLARYGVNYVVIGPDERNRWSADETKFADRLVAVERFQSNTIYEVGGGGR